MLLGVREGLASASLLDVEGPAGDVVHRHPAEEVAETVGVQRGRRHHQLQVSTFLLEIEVERDFDIRSTRSNRRKVGLSNVMQGAEIWMKRSTSHATAVVHDRQTLAGMYIAKV